MTKLLNLKNIKIIFTGISLLTGIKVEGFLLKKNNKTYIVSDFDLENYYGDGTDIIVYDWYEVVPETVLIRLVISL